MCHRAFCCGCHIKIIQLVLICVYVVFVFIICTCLQREKEKFLLCMLFQMSREIHHLVVIHYTGMLQAITTID